MELGNLVKGINLFDLLSDVQIKPIFWSGAKSIILNVDEALMFNHFLILKSHSDKIFEKD